MSFQIFQETNPVAAGNVLVGALYTNATVPVLLEHFTYAGPYTGQTQLHVFSEPADRVYLYRCYESPDGTATGNIRNYFYTQPESNSYSIREMLYLTADISPVFPATGTRLSYGPDSSLLGWDWYVERVAQGSQNPNVKIIKTKAGVDTTFNDTNADGFRLAVAGDQISSNEEWAIHFYPQVSANAGSAKIINTTTILSSNTALDLSSQGNSYWLRGASTFFTITLPNLSTLVDNSPVYFISSGGSHTNVALQCFTGQKIEFYKSFDDLNSGTMVSRIVLGQNEKIALYPFTMPDTTKRWLIMYGGEGAERVGDVIYSWGKRQLNVLELDGSQNISRTGYARLWDFVSNLQSQCIVSGTDWNNTQTINGVTYSINHGKFSTGDGSTTFGLPRIWDLGFLRAMNGIAGTASYQGFAGDFQVLQMLDHRHDSLIGLLPGAPNGKGPSKVAGKYGGGTATSQTDLSSSPFNTPAANANGSALTIVGNENRPSSFGIYMLIRI